MKIKNIYNGIELAKKELLDVDFIGVNKKVNNQKRVNRAFDILEELTNELIRESIRIKQRRAKNDRQTTTRTNISTK